MPAAWKVGRFLAACALASGFAGCVGSETDETVRGEAARAEGIYSVGVDGTGGHPLNIVGSALSRGPDGRIAFRNGRRVLVMNDDGSEVSFLASAIPGVEVVTPPVWSPDGRRIAVSSGVQCDPTATCDRWDIWIVEAASRARERAVIGGDAPSWSPDGRRIAYHGDFANEGVTPMGPQSVFVARADGRSNRRIARGEFPAWSPRGKWIAYVARDGLVVRGLRLIHADGRGDRPLANAGIEFAWSPDGTRLAFAGPHPFTKALFVVDAASSQVRRIGPASSEGVGDVAWSPDGSKLAWVSYHRKTRQFRLLLAPSDASKAPIHLAGARRGSTITTPVFSADGTRVLYAVSTP